MTRHLNLLASAPQTTPRAAGLPTLAAPVLTGVLLVLAGLAVFWTQLTTTTLASQLHTAKQALKTDAPGAGRLDATVIAALRAQVTEREAQAASFGAATQGGGEAASAWLDALDAAGGPGVALNQVRIESGARLSIAGSALQTADVHAFLARLQQHPLSGRAAIGQLEIRREDGARNAAGGTAPTNPSNGSAPLSFHLSPPAPDAAVATPNAAVPSTPPSMTPTTPPSTPLPLPANAPGERR